MCIFQGPIERVSVPFDKETEKIRGFGFVTYKHLASIDYALNIFAGTKLFGRELNIKYRNAKKNFVNSQLQQQQQLQNTPSLSFGLGVNPLALAVGDLMRVQHPQIQIQANLSTQQRLVMMTTPGMLSSAQNTFQNPFRMDEYPSSRSDDLQPSSIQRNRDNDSFVDRRRYQDREDNRSRANPYRRRSRSRSKSPPQHRGDNENRRRFDNNRDNRGRDRSSGNYHRWNRR